MGWHTDTSQLALDLKDAGHDPSVTVCSNTIYVAQIGTGLRKLQHAEYLAICALLDKHPMHYDEWGG